MYHNHQMKIPDYLQRKWDAIKEHDRLEKEELLPALLAKNEAAIEQAREKMREQVKIISEVRDA